MSARRAAKEQDLNRRLARMPLNDDGNAQRLMERYGDVLLYADGYRWVWFNGKVWDLRTGLYHASQLAKRTAQAIHAEAETLRDQDQLPETCQYLVDIGVASDKEVAEQKINERREKIHGHAVKSGNTRAVSDMLTSARDHCVVAPDIFDQCVDRFACENGTVALFPVDKQGEKHAPEYKRSWRADDLMSALIPCAYDPDATCPEFQRFLARAQPDGEMRAFLQRLAGYILTGRASEQVVILMYGAAAAGKG
ncbi:MAG: hypothetical protein AAF360_10165, partial [Pseudomonadota bacterium]